jgi:disulfide bond formation protein DsbB
MKNSFTWAAFFTALLALTGSLLLSWQLNLKACPLCLYQRTFVMGVVGLMCVGLCVGGLRPGLLSLLALPLACGGLAVAGFHMYLVQTGVLECPQGLFDLGLAPLQSLIILALLTGLLLTDIIRSGSAGHFSWLAILTPAILGVLLGFAAIRSAPPLPPVPSAGYPKPVNEDGCRPVFRQPSRGQKPCLHLSFG